MISDFLILIIEDDRATCDLLHKFLQRDGFRTVDARNAKAGLELFLKMRPDLVLLDITLPDRSGYEVLAEIRRHGNTPVIFVTARRDSNDELQGLRIGSDDYITKPFNPDVVVARVATVLKRGDCRTANQVMRAGNLIVDISAQKASVKHPTGQTDLNLTPKEFSLVACFVRSPGRAFERSTLIDLCYTGYGPYDRTIDSHISNLRSKLRAAGASCMPVSVREYGYRLDINDEE